MGYLLQNCDSKGEITILKLHNIFLDINTVGVINNDITGGSGHFIIDALVPKF